MNNTQPQLDTFPGQQYSPYTASISQPWYRSRRLFIFMLVFLISSVISLLYVYSRPAIFRSYATLLTVAPTAIDRQSGDADIQHVAIQRQLLTGNIILEQILQRLKQIKPENLSPEEQGLLTNLTVSDIRNRLKVQAVPETNLVELSAMGHYPKIIMNLVNIWIDVYLEKRAQDIRQTTGATLSALREELAGLEQQIAIKRTELEQFRSRNNITSLDRKNVFENQSLARFKALNKSFNQMTEDKIKAKAHLDAVKKAISEGKIIMPNEDKRGMRVLELRLQELREKLAEFDRKYTRSYLALYPDMNVLPGQIKDLEREIQKKRHYGQIIVLNNAEQEYNAATQALQAITQQLEQHKQEATEFSSKFAEYESLLNALEGLQELQRNSNERLVQIEAKQAENFPQVKVIERAFLAHEPISPDYNRDALIAVAGSFVLGLFFVWMIEFLMRKETHKASVSISGVNMYNGPPGIIDQVNDALAYHIPQTLKQDDIKSLEQTLPEELSVSEISSLLRTADLKGRQLIALLLSGLSLQEVLSLQQDDIDLAGKTIKVRGDQERFVVLPQLLKQWFEQSTFVPAWNDGIHPVTEKMLKAILTYSIVDAGINADKISADLITHSYIMYLVKQGIRLSELITITGAMDPELLAQYSHYSPEHRGLSASEVNLLYPSLSEQVSEQVSES